MIFRYLFCLIITISTFLPAQDYLWPTDASELMTSSFCEFRPRHYHAAIDIKTWNQTGFKIFAIEDGYVYRIRVAATGYGKAIYLKLKDGNFVVYAHLDGFTPELESYTDSLRLKARRNILDNYPGVERFPVKKGQHIGYTGETGIGVPHLHFEIRDKHHRPMNPLKYYKHIIKDTTAPRPRYLAVVPQGPKSFVNYKPDTLITAVAQQTRVKVKPIYLTGKAYLAMRIFDMADGNTNRFDMYRGEMFINDSLVYQVQYDRFSYDETRLLEIDKNFSLWRKGYRYYHNFYRHPANSLPFYKKTPKNGGLLSGKSLKESRNTVRIIAYDFYENKCEVEIPIIYYRKLLPRVQNVKKSAASLTFDVRSPLPLENFQVNRVTYNPVRRVPLKNFQLTSLENEVLSSYHYYRLTIPRRAPSRQAAFSFSAQAEGNVPTLPVYVFADTLAAPAQNSQWNIKFFGDWATAAANGYPVKPVTNQKAPAYFYQYEPDRSFIAIQRDNIAGLKTVYGDAYDRRLQQEMHRWTQVIPGKERTAYSEDRFLQIRFPSNAVYDTTYVSISKVAPSIPLRKQYRYLSAEYVTEPFDQPMNYGANISITLPDSIAAKKGIGAYYRKLNGSWRFLPTKRNGNTLSTRITSLEKFAIIQDTIPPTIRPLNLRKFNQSRAKNLPLRFSVGDGMSGIYRETQFRVEVDGRWTLYEYDPEEKFLIVHRKNIPSGKHNLQVYITDNAGNRTVKRYEVTNLR